MSGPGDRPREADGGWPSEDLGSTHPSEPAPSTPDPWSSGGDLWPESRDAASSWSDWPSTIPPDDDLVDEPPRALSDPWAEVWTEEADEAPPAWREPADEAPPAWRESADAAAPEPTTAAPPTPQSPAPEPAATDAWQGRTAAEGEEEPHPWARVEPWRPDVDPWGVVVPGEEREDRGEAPVGAEATTLDSLPSSAAPEREPQPEAEPEEPQPEPEPAAQPDPELRTAPEPEADAAVEARFEAEPSPTTGAWPWSRPRDPRELDWLPEPVPTEGVSADDQAAPPEAEPETASAGEPALGSTEGPSWTDAAVDRDEDRPPVATDAAGIEVDEVEAPVDEEGEADVTAPDESPPADGAPVEAVPETEEPATGVDSPWVARWFSRRRTTTPEPEEDPEQVAEAPAEASAPEDASGEAVLAEPAEPEPAPAQAEPAPPEPAAALSEADGSLRAAEPPPPIWAPTPEPIQEPADRSEQVVEPAVEPAPTATAEVWPDVDRPWERERDAEPAAPPSESTQVLPTSWEPPLPSRSDDRALEPVAGTPRTRLAEPEPDLEDELEARPSTAEQAVPWLIGFILLLAGMVIVLLALIFAGDESLGGAAPSPSATNAAAVLSPTAAPSEAPPSRAPSATPVPSRAAATPTPVPVPEYGALEMVYQGRSAALAPIYLLRRDFTVVEDPTVMAQDPSLDVRRFAWAPDGTRGAGLLADVLVSIEEGEPKRPLGDGISTVTFGADASTVYAVRVTADGGNDVANVLAIDFASGDTTELAAISYPRPSIGEEAALEEAQFVDDGGVVRIYWMDGVLRLWVLGAGSWDVAPDDGEVAELDRDEVPLLYAPRGERRISVSDGATSTLTLLDDGEEVASTSVEGLVSHVRWSPSGERVVFTLGRSAGGGGVIQDLFLWDLEDGQAPYQLTDTGANFGAEWLGTAPVWRDE